MARLIESAFSQVILATLVSLLAPCPISRATAGEVVKADACGDLAKLALPSTKIRAAVLVEAGDFLPPGTDQSKAIKIGEFCRVEATIEPTIQFEVWLPPREKWNGKFEMFGGGAAAGYIAYGQMASALEQNYATASTDTGHIVSDLSWMRNHERVVDYAYRAIHETAVRAKSVVAGYFNLGPKYSFFNACSNGGRQGLMEAQRYPRDFDGIIAIAPIYDFTGMLASQLWFRHVAFLRHRDGLPLQSLERVQAAAVAACDEIDGVKDGVVEDPRACKFDPAVLLCTEKKSVNCLTTDQLDAVRDIYAGPHDPRTGRSIISGFLPGAEAGWAPFVSSPAVDPIVTTIYQSAVYMDPQWDWRSYNFASDQDRTEKALNGMFDAVNADLKPFKDHGGKIIVIHGWSDQIVPPLMTIAYYKQVETVMASDPRDFFRLFMVPGMNHCAGGPGTDKFDAIGALDDWVTQGHAPDRIVAAHVEMDRVTRTRPLCPYPQESRWNGVDSSDLASSFTCKGPDGP